MKRDLEDTSFCCKRSGRIPPLRPNITALMTSDLGRSQAVTVLPLHSTVDDNPDLDNLDIVARDEEERYFDEEEPKDAPSPEPDGD